MSLLAQLRAHGLRLSTAGETLRVEPGSALTDQLRALIRTNKPAILEELVAESRKEKLPVGPEACVALAAGWRGEWEPRDPIERARETRRQRAIGMLRDVQTHRFAVVAGELVGSVIPVMVAIRTVDHGIVTGELAVPADRWDPALFLKFLREQDERLSA